MTAELIEALIEAIESSGRTKYEIAQAAGVERSVLTRLLKRQRGVSLETFTKLARELGLEVTVTQPRKPRKKQ